MSKLVFVELVESGVNAQRVMNVVYREETKVSNRDEM